MKKIKDSFFYPSENLNSLNVNSCYFFDVDCFLYDEDAGEVFFPEYLKLGSKQIFVFDVLPIGLVHSYKVVEKIQDSDCFRVQFISSFEKEEFYNQQFIMENFNINYPNLLFKLNLILDQKS